MCEYNKVNLTCCQPPNSSAKFFQADRYFQIEYSCGHWHGQAAVWCPTYTRTHRRCPPQFTHYEYRSWEVCSHCKPPTYTPWEYLINRRNQPAHCL